MPRLALATLGDVALFSGERRCELPSTAKARLLLVYLAMHAGRPISRDELAAIGWPESDEDRARASLSTALWAIRKSLADAGAGADALVAGRTAVTFAAEIAVDAVRFEQAAAAGDDVEADRLYAGPFLRDEYGDWAIAQRERLAQLAESVLARLLARTPDPLAARRLLLSDPYAELAYRVLIDDALARGRFATARAYAKRAADAFAELGTTPPFAAGDTYAALFSDAASDRQRTNLGLETTSFIGRDDDLGHVAHLLDEHRLVTLLGPGGTGKTRLAREVALRAVARHAEGAWFVDLAPLAENADIDVAVLRALGAREDPQRGAADVLDETLAQHDVLLVLDNCEHVVDAVADMVARVLPAAPLTRFLATSREPLRLAGEWLVDVAPLVADDAVALFAERARAADRRFALGDEPVRALVREICGALDGLPLAIELAAARVRYDPLESIRASLHDEPTGPAGTLRNVAPRARSLRSSIAWSVNRLEPAVRTVFGRAGIFAGAFDESGLVAVAGDGARGALDTLVGRSLVATVDVRGRRRYRLLETTRAYARELFAADPAAADVRTAYARDVLEHAMTARERLLGPGAPGALLELDDAAPDVTAALEIVFAAGPESAPAAVNAVYRLARYWNERGAHAHAEGWFARAAALDVAPNLRGELAYARSLLKGTARDSVTMEAALREALEWFEIAGDLQGQARCWNGLGIVHQNRLQYGGARSAFERSLALAAGGRRPARHRLRALELGRQRDPRRRRLRRGGALLRRGAADLRRRGGALGARERVRQRGLDEAPRWAPAKRPIGRWRPPSRWPRRPARPTPWRLPTPRPPARPRARASSIWRSRVPSGSRRVAAPLTYLSEALRGTRLRAAPCRRRRARPALPGRGSRGARALRGGVRSARARPGRRPAAGDRPGRRGDGRRARRRRSARAAARGPGGARTGRPAFETKLRAAA